MALCFRFGLFFKLCRLAMQANSVCPVQSWQMVNVPGRRDTDLFSGFLFGYSQQGCASQAGSSRAQPPALKSLSERCCVGLGRHWLHNTNMNLRMNLWVCPSDYGEKCSQYFPTVEYHK